MLTAICLAGWFFLAMPTLTVVGPFADAETCEGIRGNVEVTFSGHPNKTSEQVFTRGCWPGQAN
jgi:hypothetical protein